MDVVNESIKLATAESPPIAPIVEIEELAKNVSTLCVSVYVQQTSMSAIFVVVYYCHCCLLLFVIAKYARLPMPIGTMPLSHR